MKSVTMLGDVLSSLLRGPVTERYPFERREAPAHLRGQLQWDPEHCTGCKLCMQDCPADAIRIITVDKATKQFVMEYHTDRCTFCSQCVISCRQECISLSADQWELATLSRESFRVLYGKESHVEFVLAGEAAGAEEG